MAADQYGVGLDLLVQDQHVRPPTASSPVISGGVVV
jgi:hypothetical protein